MITLLLPHTRFTTKAATVVTPGSEPVLFHLVGPGEEYFVDEIIPEPLSLHERLKRTMVEVMGNLASPLSWDELAARLVVHDSVLCIVNRRDDARGLWEKMPEGTFHLSALMCGAHRSARIAEIKESLAAKKPTRVISTQLVEAGVDGVDANAVATDLL